MAAAALVAALANATLLLHPGPGGVIAARIVTGTTPITGTFVTTKRAKVTIPLSPRSSSTPIQAQRCNRQARTVCGIRHRLPRS